MLTRLHQFLEVEYLPVYYPDEEEQADPELYAANIQRLLAYTLNVPISDYGVNDVLLQYEALKVTQCPVFLDSPHILLDWHAAIQSLCRVGPVL